MFQKLLYQPHERISVTVYIKLYILCVYFLFAAEYTEWSY